MKRIKDSRKETFWLLFAEFKYSHIFIEIKTTFKKQVIDQILEVRKKKEMEIDMTHMGILFSLDFGQKGYFVKEDFVYFAEFCLKKMDDWKGLNFQVKNKINQKKKKTYSLFSKRTNCRHTVPFFCGNTFV